MKSPELDPESRNILAAYLEQCIRLIVQGRIQIPGGRNPADHRIETIRRAVLLEERLKETGQSPSDLEEAAGFINDFLLLVIEEMKSPDLDWISKMLLIRKQLVENQQ